MAKRSKSMSIDEVRELMASQGCKLLSDKYKSVNEPVKYQCSCGNQSTVRLLHFQRGTRCKECGVKKGASTQRLSIEEVQRIFEDAGCKLLTTEYKNNLQKLRFLCTCGREASNSLSNFKAGQRQCKTCGVEKLSQSRRTRIEDIKILFEMQGCVLLSDEYTKPIQLLDYLCNCGSRHSITLGNFKAGHRCKACGIRKSVQTLTENSKKRKFEEMKKILLSEGNKLLRLYKRVTTTGTNEPMMEYECGKGHTTTSTSGNYKNGHRCGTCVLNKRRVGIERARKLFKDGGCSLLETEYSNCEKPMKYICNCGDVAYMSLSNFKKGKRCKRCGIESAKKTSFIRKPFSLPSGKTLLLQGYEHYCIKDLLETYSEEEIKHSGSEVPMFRYKLDGKQHRYYPDFYIPKDNKIVEVKSVYTWNLEIFRNMEKLRSVERCGYIAELRVYDVSGECLYVNSDWSCAPFELEMSSS